MSELGIFAAGLIATTLCGFFLVFSYRELRRLGREADEDGRGRR